MRDLKTKDPKSDATKAAIAKLLELKTAYKAATGQEWKPGQAPAATSAPAPPALPTGNDAATLYKQVSFYQKCKKFSKFGGKFLSQKCNKI